MTGAIFSKLFCALVAVISTLPHYFYYTLKDNTTWNAFNGSKDNGGLLRICILYEISVFSFFYLILQGDVNYTLSKLIISIINIILISIYLILLLKGNGKTVSLIKGSIELGYRCFHEECNQEELDKIEQLGEAFGYVFQYLNDLEPFSQRSLYEKHKGKKSHFDYGKKNIAMSILYTDVSDEEKIFLVNRIMIQS